MPETTLPVAYKHPQVGRKTISQRAYMGFLGFLVFAGFALIAVCSGVVAAFPTFFDFDLNPGLSWGVMIGSFVLSIGGLILQFVGARDADNPNMALIAIGYILLVGSLGFSTALILQLYDFQTITSAFIGTALIAAGMTCAGFAFPNFFRKIYGALFIALICVIIATIIMMFLGINSIIIDWIVLIIFSGFMAFDSYNAANDRPTYANALMWASHIYLDLINIFASLLSIFNDA